MGLKNAPKLFQRAMEIMLAGPKWKFALFCLDDSIEYSKFATEHFVHVLTVLTLRYNAEIELKLSNRFFSECNVKSRTHDATGKTVRGKQELGESLRVPAPDERNKMFGYFGNL